jgi:hypothetical protein
MPSSNTGTPRRSSEVAGVEDAIGLFRSESEPDDEARDWTPPPTGYRPVVPEEIRPTAQRGLAGVLVGASVVLLVTLLGVVLTLNRQRPSSRPPLDLTPPSTSSLGSESRPSAASTASPAPAVTVLPPAATEVTRDTPEAPARSVAAPDAVAERSVEINPPPAATVEEAPASPPRVTSEPLAVSATNVEVLPAPPPVLSTTGTPALEDIAAAAVPPPPPPAVTVTVEPLTGDQLAHADITRTLDAYRQSYSALDASAVSMIWVGLDTKALQRAFSTLSRQDLAFDHCDLDISSARNRARASCTGVLNYVRRIGSGDEHQRQMSWAIDLVRNGDRWLIENVAAR